MRHFLRRPIALPLGLLFGALVLPAAALSAPPAGFRGMMGTPGGMMAPAPAFMMRTTPSAMAPGLGLNQGGFRPMTYPQTGYSPSTAAMAGRNGYGSSAMSGGGGYSGGGSGPSSAAGMPSAYDSSAGTYAAAPAASQNATGGPLVGLANAEGGLDWPLALRILPPGLETSDLRKRIDARAAELQREAAGGQMDATVLREANRDVDRLGALLADRGDFLPVSQQATTEGRQFLERLRDALKVVPEPAAHR
jgi:hypothetical protein